MLLPIVTTDPPEAQERIKAMNREIFDRAVGKHSEEAPDLPRLTVANTFLTYQRVGIQLEQACTRYKALPDAKSQQDTTEGLKELIRSLEAAAKHAARLLEANA
jgi:hypothetical protein